MQETPETLLEETSELLDVLAPVVQRSIEALQHDLNPLLQHLVQQEVEHQEDLLQRIEEIKGRLHDFLNPPEDVPQSGNEQESDLPLTEITGGPSPVGPLPAGAARRQRNPVAVTIPDRNLRICCPKGIDTLIKVIKELGIEEVRAFGIMSHGIPLIAINYYDGPNQIQVGRYYIAGNSSTDTKAEQIKEIARCLDIRLDVEQLNIL